MKENQLNKKHLAQRLSKELNIPLVRARKAIAIFWGTISDGLAQQKRVIIVGFGAFHPVNRRGRRIRHPRTFQEMYLPERIVVVFRPGKMLKEAVGRPRDME